MATVHFTSQLERFLETPVVTMQGTTLAEVLAAVFALYPQLEGYVVDDQSAIRRHVALFIDGEQAADRERLSNPVGAEAEIYVLQALSGG